MRSVKDCFPFPEAREGQMEAINEILSAIIDGYRYIVLEAGTGTGKSAIAMTIAQMLEDAYICTMTKQLQEQYMNDFHGQGVVLMKGRNNYKCKYTQKEYDVSVACNKGECKTLPERVKFSCPYGITKEPYNQYGENIWAFNEWYYNFLPDYAYESDYAPCEYWENKAKGINSAVTVMNYHYFMAELKYIRHFRKRELVVFDEAHNIENIVMQHYSEKISMKRLNDELDYEIKPELIKRTIESDKKHNRQLQEIKEEWLIELRNIKFRYGKRLDELDSKNELSKVYKERKVRWENKKKKMEEIIGVMEEDIGNWIITVDKDSVVIKPLMVWDYAEELLFKHGHVCLFMSATIFNHEKFCEFLGIPEEKVYSIRMPSKFKKEQRPVRLDTVGRMSFKYRDKNLPKLCRAVEEILERHSEEKGLIHTNSYPVQKYLSEHLQNERILTHNSFNREETLRKFKDEKDNPLVLVSPSMTEGVDLPYDDCRFQIVCVIPFPSLADKQIRERLARSQDWYDLKTVQTLAQAYGRGMRNEEDSCTTYILDSNIHVLKNRGLLPRYLTEAIV